MESFDPQKTTVDQNCYTDLLKTSLMPECRRLYPGNDCLSSRKTVLRHIPQKRHNGFHDTTEHSKRHNCWRMGIMFSRS